MAWSGIARCGMAWRGEVWYGFLRVSLELVFLTLIQKIIRCGPAGCGRARYVRAR